MYTLTYESIATKRMSTKDMDELLETARVNNARDQITGCLIYYMGGFVQVLEGEKDAIVSLYEKIKLDPRHTDIHMFSDDSIKKRTFSDWGMAYYPISEHTTSKSEFEQFKRNLLLLSDLVETNSVTANLFWKRIKVLIASPPAGL